MIIIKDFESWKYPMILLFGIGIANVGAWIFLIALNLIVLDMTGSPLALGVLYILKPLATMVTNVWSGSLIDRINKRKLMICLDLSRALFIAVLPFLDSIWLIYSVVFIINMASAMFEPTSMTYITKLIPHDQRKRFNSLRSLVDSGGFLIGPAIAGVLFIAGSPTFAIFINALAFFVSGMLTTVMPNLEKERKVLQEEDRFSIELLKKDWKTVMQFSRRNRYIVLVVFLFNCVLVMTAAVDSLEAAYAKDVLSLTNSTYGFLVSIAGAGFVVGAIVNTFVATRLSTSILIGIGSLTVSLGYIIYALSADFFGAALGFFILSFSLAFANTGFHTFYQSNIPVDVMGRVGSVYGLIEAVLIMVTTVLLGIAAQLVSIRIAVVVGVAIMFIIALILLVMNHQRSSENLTQPV